MSPLYETQVKASHAGSLVSPSKKALLRKCDKCHKKQLLKRSSEGAGPRSVPPIVYEVLCSPGRPLDPGTRAFFEPRFAHDFGRVRVHTEPEAARSARQVSALAYTMGSDIVFDSGKYAPERDVGRSLLAHELTHVVQQGSASENADLTVADSDSSSEAEARKASKAVASGRITDFRPVASASGIQRENGDEDERKMPDSSQSRQSMGGGGNAWQSNVQKPWYQLQLDPRIGSQLAVMQYTDRTLSTESLRRSLLQIDYSTLQTTQPPPWVTTPSVPPAKPLVPKGAGPSVPRPATTGDIIKGAMRIPAVDSALTRLRTEASDQAKHVWRELRAGGRIVLLTQTALIGSGALAGILSSPEARQFAFQQLQGTNIPMPGIPGLTFQLNLASPQRSVMFNLNLGEMFSR